MTPIPKVVREPKAQKQLRRTRLKQGFGRKAKREQATLDAARIEVRLRARGYCEASELYYVDFNRDDARVFTDVCRRQQHDGSEVHHVWPEDRDYGRHEPDRMLLLCSTAHAWAHANPARAASVGLLRPDRGTVSE